MNDVPILRPRLQIVELGHRGDRSAEHRIGRDVVAGAPAGHPHLARIAAQPLDELLSVPRCHQSVSKL
jgi:hypothetical protein